MKNFRKIILAACMLAAAATNGFAQPKQDCSWKDRMQSELIAFITEELALTPEESQTFWPVYNQASEKRFQANGKVMKAMKMIHKAVADGSGNFDALMDAYVKASQEKEKMEAEYVATIRKAFGDEKAAKLIVAEEKFRRSQIHRLGGGQKPGTRQGGPGPVEHGPYRARE